MAPIYNFAEIIPVCCLSEDRFYFIDLFSGVVGDF